MSDYYKEFLDAVSTYIGALNEAVTKIDEKEDLTPYANQVPILFNDRTLPTGTSLEGWLVDEIGGEYSFRPATDEEKAWWQTRPRS